MTLAMADQIATSLDPAVDWPYIVLPILEDLGWNGWRVDVVNAETKHRLTLVDVTGRLLEHSIPATGSTP